MDRSIYEDFRDSEEAPAMAVQHGAAEGAHTAPYIDTGQESVRPSSQSRPLLPVTETDTADGLDPTDLSAQERANWHWANIDNLDVFLQEVYQYFLDKGFYSILLTRALNMFTILFVVSFATYLSSCVDYGKLSGARRLSDAKIPHCIAQTSFPHRLVLWLFGALWFAKCFQYVSDIRRLWELHEFYLHLLEITDDEIQTISWQQVVDRIVKLRATNLVAGRPHRRPLDAHGIVNRIMRKENYMIALYNRNIFDLNLALPLVGNYQFLTKTLEWSISLCVTDYVFNERGHLRPAFLNEAKRAQLAAGLRRRFQFVAIMNIVFAPAAVVYMTLYYFLRYFNDFKSEPSNMGMRQYTPLAEWKMRELNELYHLFKRRLSMSDRPARRYISQFPREKTEIMLRFVIFICSSFLAVMVTLSLWEPHMLNIEISTEKSASIYIAGMSIIIAVCRGMLADEAAIFQPEAAMRQIVEFTHYLPEEWEGRLHTEHVKNEFCQLYDLKVKIILRELLSVVLNPAILGLRLSENSERLVDFFREFSIHVEDLGGYVCSYAVFNLDQNNKTKARAETLDKYYATSDGKMLKSYLNFMDVYGPPSKRRPGSVMAPPPPANQQFNGSQSLYGPYSSAYTPNGGLSVSGSSFTNNLGGGHGPNPSQVGGTGAMHHSVMGEFERLRHLGTVREGSNTDTDVGLAHDPDSVGLNSTGLHGTTSTEFNMFYSDDDDEDAVDHGVLGLLNNLYKADGRRR